VPLERHDLLVGALARLSVEPEHERDVRPRDVGIEEPDGRPVPGEGHGEVHGHGALADAPLARGHGDDVLHARQELLGGPRGGATNAGTPRELNGFDPDRIERGMDPRFDLVLERASRGGELDREGNGIAVDLQLPDHVPGHEVAAELWLLDGAERGHDGVLGDLGHEFLGAMRFGIPTGVASIS
jgi:hypothetical protein